PVAEPPVPPRELPAVPGFAHEEPDEDEDDDTIPAGKTAPAPAVAVIPQPELKPPLQQADAPGDLQEEEQMEAPHEPAPLLATAPHMSRGHVTLHQEPDSPREAELPAGDPGWNCNKAEDRKTWDCDLVGADPRGLPHSIGDNGQRGPEWSESGALTPQDEQRFSSLLAMMPADPWANACTGKTERDAMKNFLLSPADRKLRETASTDARGNYGELQHGEIATFVGTAEVTRADQHVQGHSLSFNTTANTVNARGNALYREKGMAMAGDSAFMDMDTGKGVLRNAQFIIETMPSRGTARTVYLDSNNQMRFSRTTYTTCPLGNKDWLLHADVVDMDKKEGWGEARHAWMEFEGLPIFYTPYMRFPIDDRRQSGLLAPTFGQSRVGGFNISAPYYFNLAPNYDDTLVLREVTNRGPLVGNEFRYLTDHQKGRLAAEIMPYDSVMQQARGIVGFKDQGNWSENLSSLVDINYVSDQLYLNQLGNSLRLVPSLYMHSQANLTYRMDNLNLKFLSDYYETIDPSIPNGLKPYNRLPALQANYRSPVADSGFVFETKSEVSSFAHNSGDVKGQRFNLRPTISYPVRKPEGFVVPSLSVQNTNYLLSDIPPDTQSMSGQYSSSMNRVAPIASIDSGLTFERDLNIGDRAMLQTLEPRLFYLYVPHINQKNLPLFDTTYYDYTFNQMFRENRFVGSDRIGDANQTSLALTTRLLDADSGMERFRASLGKVVYFSDPTVTLQSDILQDSIINENCGAAPPVNTPQYEIWATCSRQGAVSYFNYDMSVPASQYNFNDYIAEVGGRISREWSYELGGQASPSRGQLERGSVTLRYDNDRNQLLNLSYRFRRPITGTTPGIDQSNVNTSGWYSTLNQTDASFRLPIAKDFYAIARWQYSLEYQMTLDSFAGIERDTCCWRLSILGRRYQNGVDASKEPTTNTGIFVQLELKGLTRLGDQVDQFLYRSVEGYRKQSDLEESFIGGN
ncbi:MAG: hypothetical protein RIQ52_1129, partial [Pseudomonadota bacterium]